MDQKSVHGKPYRLLVRELSKKTSDDWSHRFFTTNWDTLLERELYPVARAKPEVPRWLGNQSHVFHLNGTIEDGANENRNPFLLETDDVHQRAVTVEANIAYNQLLWAKCAIVVGMSFRCQTDQTLLGALNRDQDNVLFGEATIYVLNPDRTELAAVCGKIKSAVPASEVIRIEQGFDSFIEGGLHELIGTVLSADSVGPRVTNLS